MFWKSNCLIFTCLFILSGCVKRIPKESIYPFSQADKIEVISYPDRMSWDKEPGSKIFVNEALRFDEKNIKERVILNEELVEKLYSFLFIEECSLLSETTRCYMPRHAILFYDLDGDLYNYIEVCLECAKSEANFQHNKICPEKAKNLKKIFKEAGIKYFSE
ncbi:hypothetical protein DVK85_11115 [Flavobacterium arcticum]|uniref:Lipoprotein n=1 Tax=Flavobacterium arcticum TaxID=1784713 RepID=A0A345HDT9_9FLAO|nr:hypothetical protein [Flavobacterium arcticum]AXG74749.1 hypothetical protein DVK85_11115 [Flavobacterium arcticum]KAF2509751.1 hypothetical protein E0W72_09560 [Flavobacterium arcticum]